MSKYRVLLAMMVLAAVQVFADETAQSKTVIGPSNIYLYDGANALLAKNAAEGVPLTLKGLELAKGLREEKVGHSNLCAGFMMLEQPESALAHCN